MSRSSFEVRPLWVFPDPMVPDPRPVRVTGDPFVTRLDHPWSENHRSLRTPDDPNLYGPTVVYRPTPTPSGPETFDPRTIQAPRSFTVRLPTVVSYLSLWGLDRVPSMVRNTFPSARGVQTTSWVRRNSSPTEVPENG